MHLGYFSTETFIFTFFFSMVAVGLTEWWLVSEVGQECIISFSHGYKS